ncbi:NADase-type glycan-binding domain-containing protein [Streptomyces sp. NPDC003247]|uniref:NADase-type glycan-binding domain-containing protein n=1 Tax=Streptomyces sp. NPDC003247 TaxID=3364677 RepID=UPI0036C6EDBF
MTTQNCAECGTRAEPGQSFCDGCGAVLSWTDRSPARTAAEPAPEARRQSAPAEPETAAARPAAAVATAGAPDTSRTPDASATADDDDTTETPLPALPPDEHTPAHGEAGRPSAPAADDTAPTEPVPAAAAASTSSSTSSSASASAPDDTMTARARSLLVPVADPEDRPTPPPTVVPVLPGRPVAERPQVRAVGPELGDANGLPCPWCSTPNRPDRHYCTRCAMPMTREDHSFERRSWWRRLVDWRNRETPWAGERPRLRRTFDRIVTWVVTAAVLSLLIWVGVNTPDWIQATRDHFAKRAPVAPDTIAASRSYPGHKPELAFDKINNSWWGPGVAQSGEGEWIEARFSEPTRLLDLIITPGVSTRAEQLSESALPHRIKATITLKDGTTTTRELTLDQSAGGQRRGFRVGEVIKVRFTIESAYAASDSKQVSIAEIEFFGRSNANAT